MKKTTLLGVAALAVGAVGLNAETWTPTSGGNYDWNTAANWDGVSFPDSIGGTANISGNFTGDQTISLNQNITVGSLTINDSGASGDSIVNIVPASGTLTLQVASGTATLTNSSQSLNSISANIAISSNTTINSGAVGSINHGLTLSGNLSGAGTITKTGNNSTLFLTGDNSSFTGKWVFSSNGSTGRISINGDNTLGAAPGVATSDYITVANNNVLHFNSAGVTTLNANRGITINGGALILSTQFGTTLGVIEGNITGVGGVSRNSAISTNGVVLSGSNNYTGGTSVTQGALRAGSNYAFGDNSAVSLGTASTARLELNGFHNSIGSLAGGGSGPAGSVTLGSGTLTTGGNNTSTDYIGQISGSGGFTKVGTGTQTLSGSSSYTGATNINAGTLLINGALGNTAVAVNTGGTLAGSGTIGGAVTVGLGGVLAPGSSIESLDTGALSFANGSTFALEIDTNLGTSDLVNVTGNLSITGGAFLTLTDLGSDAPLNAILTVIDYSGSWNGGLFTYNGNELADGETFSFGANNYTIDYDNSGAVTLAVAAIPEPGAAALAGVALGWMLLIRRKRA